MKHCQKNSDHQRPVTLGAIAAAVLTALVYTPSASAVGCDSITNTVFGSLNEACGSNNFVGGTYGSTLPEAGPASINNIAFGVGNRASNGYSTAVGTNNSAIAVYSTAVGSANEARGRDSTAVGTNNIVGAHPGRDNDGRVSSAFGASNFVSSNPTDATGGYSTAMGSRNEVYGSRSTAMGDNNRVGSLGGATQGIYYQKSTAVGYQNWIYGDNSIAMGSSTEVGGSDTLGGTANIANRAVAIGTDTRARQNGTIAIGDTALAGMSGLNGPGLSGTSFASYNAIAIGTNAKVYGTATTTGLASIAIGSGAASTGDSSVALGESSTDGGQSNVLSVGNATTQRRIINVAAGVAATDVANVGQLNTLGSATATALGTGTYNASTNTIGGVNFVVGSSNYTSVAGAIGALQGFTPNTGYFSATGIGVASAAAADATAMGANSLAQGQFSIAAGNGAFATGNNASALGSGTSASGTGSTAVGYNATASGANASAIGLGAVASGNNSVALGANSSDGGQSNVVSVGSATAQRRITNVAPGEVPTDAVNLNQLNAMKNTLNTQMNEIGNKAYAGTATVAAVAGIPALAPNKQFNIGVGLGNYLNQTATAIGGHARVNDNLVIKAALGFANSTTTTSIGLGFAF